MSKNTCNHHFVLNIEISTLKPHIARTMHLEKCLTFLTPPLLSSWITWIWLTSLTWSGDKCYDLALKVTQHHKKTMPPPIVSEYNWVDKSSMSNKGRSWFCALCFYKMENCFTLLWPIEDERIKFELELNLWNWIKTHIVYYCRWKLWVEFDTNLEEMSCSWFFIQYILFIIFQKLVDFGHEIKDCDKLWSWLWQWHIGWY